MTPGLGFALGAMACFGLSDIIYKRGATAGIASGDFLMTQAWIFCPGVTLYAWLSGNLDVHFSALWGALIAVWLLLAEAGVERGKARLASLAQVLLATVCMALTNLFYKIGLQHGVLPDTMVAAQAWMFCSLATIVGFMRDGIRVPQRDWSHGALAAVALFGAFVLLLHGLALGPASVLVPVAQMSFVITALAGIGFLGERLDPRKGLGLAVGTVALVLFAVS